MSPLGASFRALLGAAGSGSAVAVEVGSFTKQTATGDQDVTIATDLTGAADGSWAIMFWTGGSDQASGTWDADVASTLGFVANGGGAISQYAVHSTSRDALATSRAHRRMAAVAISLGFHDGTNHLLDEATFVSFPTATTARINWSTQDAAHNSVINYAIFSGLTNAKVVNWTAPTSATSKAVTGVGFTPDLVLHASHSDNVLGSDTQAYFGFGAMNADGEQWANSFYSQDGVADSNTSRWQRTDACLLGVDTSEAASVRAAFTSMDADGFTTTFAVQTFGVNAPQVVSLCMDGVQSKIGSFNKTTDAAPATQTVTASQSFTPTGVLLSNIKTAAAAGPTPRATWALGASDLTNDRAAGLMDHDAQATTLAGSVWYSDKAALVPEDNAKTTLAAGSVSAVTDTTFDIAWTTNDSGTYEILYLLIG